MAAPEALERAPEITPDMPVVDAAAAYFSMLQADAPRPATAATADVAAAEAAYAALLEE